MIYSDLLLDLWELKLKVMTMQELKIFEEKQIRTIWDEVQEKWYFCINDVIAALTDSKDPAEYFKKIRRRDSELDDFVRGTNCPPHQFIATDGKRHSAKFEQSGAMTSLSPSRPLRLICNRQRAYIPTAVVLSIMSLDKPCG